MRIKKSISLYEDDIKFIKESSMNFSKFVREKIKEERKKEKELN